MAANFGVALVTDPKVAELPCNTSDISVIGGLARLATEWLTSDEAPWY